MIRLSKIFATLVLATLAAAAGSQQASAISAELAKKCREMAIRAHPTALAGAHKGTAEAQRDYFKACVDKDGQIDAPPAAQKSSRPGK